MKGNSLQHYKIRVAFPGSLIHLASYDEPKMMYEGGRLVGIECKFITYPEFGDTVGFIDWGSVIGVTWRYCG